MSAASKGHVLNCEDHNDTRVLMTMMLEQAGFQVTGVGNGTDCLGAAWGGGFDLYLLDHTFPELESHIQMHAEDYLRSGMTTEEARRQAVIKLGGVEATKEEYRCRRGVPAVENLLRDLRYGGRALHRSPSFTAVAVLSLALGIGATTAIFNVVYATLFETLPYPKPEQLVMVWSSVNQMRNSVSTGDYLEWKRRSSSFQYLEAWTGATFNVATDERPEQVQAALMTPDTNPPTICLRQYGF